MVAGQTVAVAVGTHQPLHGSNRQSQILDIVVAAALQESSSCGLEVSKETREALVGNAFDQFPIGGNDGIALDFFWIVVVVVVVLEDSKQDQPQSI